MAVCSFLHYFQTVFGVVSAPFRPLLDEICEVEQFSGVGQDEQPFTNRGTDIRRNSCR